MLTVPLMRMQELDTSDGNIRDVVGEVANTLAGNARRDFGPLFRISVVLVLVHSEQDITAPHARSFFIPIHWRAHSAKLVVCLQ
jgi:chemotaxis protein CheX